MNSLEPILKQHVENKGLRQVGAELGYSTAVVSQVLADKYTGNNNKFWGQVNKVYGNGGVIDCPMKGELTPAECAEYYENAKAFGSRATGNPATYRLYQTCLKRCPIRNT